MTQHVRSFALRCIIALSCGAASFGTQVTGRVTLVGRTTRAGTNVVVYAESLSDPHVAPKPGHYEWEQRNKTFVPHLLAIPVGSTVTFPNDDPIFHNVFSLSRPQPFDLGLYRAGASKVRVFSEPGTYRIFCNIHPQMTGLLLVVPTSWIAETDAGGGYKLDLPPGRYRASILLRLAAIRTWATGPRDGVACFREALTQTGGDDALEAEIQLELADSLRFASGLGSALPHAQAAIAAAERAGNDELLCRALAVFGLVHFKLGRGIERDVMALEFRYHVARQWRGE